jgi:hypothetical protein
MLKTHMISGLVEAGCDEAGRGPLAGSVFAAAVILNPERIKEVPEFAWLNDSKQLTEKQRETLRPVIEKEALSWAVVEVTPKEIDERNILQCSIIGMQRALDKLAVRPQHILVDGNKWKPYVPAGELLEIPADTVGLLCDRFALQKSGFRIQGDLTGGEDQLSSHHCLRVRPDGSRCVVGVYLSDHACAPFTMLLAT